MIKKQILNYIKNVLEVPRDEYDGLSACPFVKKERENNNIYIKNLDNNDINPKDEFEVDGLNVRSQAPCFLILINNQKEINTAHERMLKTKYFDKMSIKYKEFLGIKNMV